MAYAKQEDNKVAETQYPNFDEALKTYQEEVKQTQATNEKLLGAKIQLEEEISGLLSSKSKLETDCLGLQKNADNIGEQIRKEVLQAEKDIEGKRTALAVDIENQWTALKLDQDRITKEDKRLYELRGELATKAGELEEREAVIASNEAILAGNLSDAARLNEKALDLKAKNEDLEASLMKKDAALKLVSEELAAEAERQKTANAQLKQREIELSSLSSDVHDRLVKVEGLEAEKAEFAKAKEGFEDARDKLAVREMAIAEAESQIKNWQNDLKQREELLTTKYKEI